MESPMGAEPDGGWTDWDRARELREAGYGSRAPLRATRGDPSAAGLGYEAAFGPSDADDERRPRRWRDRCTRASAILVFLAGWVGVLGAASGARAAVGVVESLEESASSARIEASNARTRYAGFAAGRGYPRTPEGSIIEPRVLTTLSLGGAAPPAAGEIAWTVAGAPDGSAAAATVLDGAVGSTVDFSAPFVGDYVATARWGAGGVATRAFRCLYVRRNLRSLMASDRDAFFDAVKALASYDASTGRAAYGGDFLPLSHFVQIHLAQAGDKLGDHLHDGMGFLTQHLALTNAFERALRVVDGAVSVPYWDYTEDHVLATAAGAGDSKHLWALDVWGADWFGDASTSDAHCVSEGRFAYQAIENDRSSSATTNPYGYFRAPWNMNKSPFLTRHHKMAGTALPLDAWSNCYAAADFTFTAAQTLYEYLWASQYLPHGPVHTMIGGYGTMGDLRGRLEGVLDEDAWGSFTTALLYIPKDMYREATTVAFPKYCSDDAPQEACHMVCPTREMFAESGFNAEMGQLLKGYDWFARLDENRTGHFLNVLCTTPWSPGEQLEAGSPADVSFWPMHPHLDRLLQYKRIAAPFDSADWAAPSGDDTRYCVRDDATACRGHHAEDITTFTTRVLEEETGAYGDAALTNGELFQYADPRDYRLDYVYDHFDYVHCDTLGANATAFPHFPRLAWAADAADGGDRRPSDAAGDGGRDARVAEDAAAPGPAAAAVVPNSGQRTGAPGR